MIINDMMQFQHSAYHNIHVPFHQYYAYNSNLTLYPGNHTLSATQKELLLWHFKLGHVNMRWIQQLLRQRDWIGPMTYAYGNVITEFHSYLPSSNTKASTCDPPMCTTCVMAKSSAEEVHKLVSLNPIKTAQASKQVTYFQAKL